MAGGILPLYAPGESIPITVGSGGITEGKPITTTGVAAADAETKFAGIAGYTALEGAVVTVWRGGLFTVIASAAVANGDPICCAGSGKFRKWVAADVASTLIGRAFSVASGDGVAFTLGLGV